MNKNLAVLLMLATLGAAVTTTACKKEEPNAVEKLGENVKDGLDMRDNEKLKDAGENAADAMKDAGEAVKDAVTPNDPPK